MRLLKFRIKDFRSIGDTGECELASDITVLAGKNEAGKTIIVQALEKFNEDKNFVEEDKPIDNPEAKPEVDLTFKLSKRDLSEIIEGIEIPNKINKRAILEIPFSITKSFNNTYSFGGPNGSIVNFLIKNYKKQNKKIIDELNKRWSEIKKVFQNHDIQNYPLKDIKKIENGTITQIKTQFLPAIEQFIIQLPSEDQEGARELKENIENIIAEIETNIEKIKNNCAKLLELIPNFVLFNGFDKEEFLPFDPITLEEAENNQAVKNYFLLTDTDINKLKELRDQKNDQSLSAYIRNKSYILEEDFKNCWNQDKIDLRLQWGIDNKIAFYFYEKRKKKPLPFKLNQRSKGLQWFLSFYLTVAAECRKYNSIILIDEPGLFVHAKAQEDILDILTNRLSKENQIIFTTHSPYLIDPNRLDRIKLVVKDLKIQKNRRQYLQRGTKIYPLTKEVNIDKESLTPIITAIGLDISKSLTIAADNNIVLEGPSDYYFLQAALKFCNSEVKENIKKLKQFHLIPCTGANNIPSVISILFGWGLNFVVVLDNDQKGKEIYGILIKKSPTKEEKIKFASGKDNYCIEDLFSKTDFNKYILNKPENYEIDKLNSQVIPDSQKLIFSRQFFNSIITKKIQLSTETKENFRKLLKDIFNILGQEKIS